MSDLKPIKIKATLFYTRDLHTVNTFFDEDNEKYECTLAELSEAAAAALDAVGIRVKEKEGLGKFVKSKSKFVFELVDKEGNKIDAKEVGSGTKVTALVSGYTHKLSKKWGLGVRVKKLIVDEMVPFTPSVEGATEEEEEAL